MSMTPADMCYTAALAKAKARGPDGSRFLDDVVEIVQRAHPKIGGVDVDRAFVKDVIDDWNVELGSETCVVQVTHHKVHHALLTSIGIKHSVHYVPHRQKHYTILQQLAVTHEEKVKYVKTGGRLFIACNLCVLTKYSLKTLLENKLACDRLHDVDCDNSPANTITRRVIASSASEETNKVRVVEVEGAINVPHRLFGSVGLFAHIMGGYPEAATLVTSLCNALNTEIRTQFASLNRTFEITVPLRSLLRTDGLFVSMHTEELVLERDFKADNSSKWRVTGTLLVNDVKLPRHVDAQQYVATDQHAVAESIFKKCISNQVFPNQSYLRILGYHEAVYQFNNKHYSKYYNIQMIPSVKSIPRTDDVRRVSALKKEKILAFEMNFLNYT